MKINYGAGRQVLNGYVNVDAVRNPQANREPEVLHALRFTPEGSIIEKTPIDDESADELLAAHVVEHFHRWCTDAVIQEWKRMLKPGGRLIIECPNILLCAKSLIEGKRDQLSYWGFWGDPGHKDPYMCHLWGWHPASLQQLLEDNGFTDVQHRDPQTHKARTNRDMRVEARKP